MNNQLIHYGILGMRWGVRRYQNPDGSLTDLGRKRHFKEREREEVRKEKRPTPSEKYTKERSSLLKSEFNKAFNEMGGPELERKYKEYIEKNNIEEYTYNDWKDGIPEPKPDKKLEKLYDDYDKVYDKAYSKSKEVATRKLLDKYGQKKIDNFNSNRNPADNVKIGLFIAGLLGTSIVLEKVIFD